MNVDIPPHPPQPQKQPSKKAIMKWPTHILLGGVEHGFYFSIYWEFHHPNWRTHIFQRGWNHQPDIGFPVNVSFVTNSWRYLYLVKPKMNPFYQKWVAWNLQKLRSSIGHRSVSFEIEDLCSYWWLIGSRCPFWSFNSLLWKTTLFTQYHK